MAVKHGIGNDTARNRCRRICCAGIRPRWERLIDFCSVGGSEYRVLSFLVQGSLDAWAGHCSWIGHVPGQTLRRVVLNLVVLRAREIHTDAGDLEYLSPLAIADASFDVVFAASRAASPSDRQLVGTASPSKEKLLEILPNWGLNVWLQLLDDLVRTDDTILGALKVMIGGRLGRWGCTSGQGWTSRE